MSCGAPRSGPPRDGCLEPGNHTPPSKSEDWDAFFASVGELIRALAASPAARNDPRIMMAADHLRMAAVTVGARDPGSPPR